MSTPQIQGRAALGKTKVRAPYANNTTGIAGISEIVRKHGKRMRRRFVVSPMRRCFAIDTLGRDEALRQAIALRAKHEAMVLAKKGAR